MPLDDKGLEQKLDSIINKFNLENLMSKRKMQLGFPSDQLTFIGIADVASYWYCAQKSFFKQLDMEKHFFRAYLSDRIIYSIKLGYINDIPQKEEELLKIGDEITFNDIEKLLKERSNSKELSIRKELRINVVTGDHVDKDELMDLAKNLAESFGESIDNPLNFGKYAESIIAEPYPTIRWNFPYKDFILVGVPDGITDRFVYEFKTSNNLQNILRIAEAQADIYGYFFSRDTKRVQIYLKRERKIVTKETPVNRNNAEITLEKATSVYNGGKPIPPAPYKCNNCEYKDKCPIYKATL
jgi:CRISPR/Cas system-associated exonuclease Cas4 (RecB family)